jgi:hypothetical protein
LKYLTFDQASLLLAPNPAVTDTILTLIDPLLDGVRAGGQHRGAVVRRRPDDGGLVGLRLHVQSGRHG